MTDTPTQSEKEVTGFFRKTAEQAATLPVRVTTIPAADHTIAGLCLIAEERPPADPQAIAAAIVADLESCPDRERASIPPPPCQVTVEERAQLFKLFSKDKG
ncbi:MAG: hypothetical protein KKG47_04555 [Proteobacteria bacterium]|nr:hypothetical protein [Pseudomonadota bacterium]MBU1738809.1 hypothetical protein [Pseudomonadota bacterium]